MSQDLRAHIRHEMLVNGIMNTLFNGVIAWFLLKGGEALTLRENIAPDLMATAAILLFIVALILILLNQRKVAQGKLSPFDWNPNKFLHRCLQRLPKSLFGRAFCVALFGLLVIAPLTAATLWLLGAHEFSPLGYSIFKGVWAGVMAALMAGPMILVALARSGNEPAMTSVNVVK